MSTEKIKSIRVEALERGYYRDVQRKKGDKFLLVPIRRANGEVILPEDQLSKKWMKVIGQGPAVEAAGAKLVPQTEALDEKNQKPGLEAGPAGEQGSLPEPEGEEGSGDPEGERDVI